MLIIFCDTLHETSEMSIFPHLVTADNKQRLLADVSGALQTFLTDSAHGLPLAWYRIALITIKTLSTATE